MNEQVKLIKSEFIAWILVAIVFTTIIAIPVGIAAGGYLETRANARAFAMIRSDDVVQQLCAELAIKENEHQDNDYLDGCVDLVRKTVAKRKAEGK